MRRPGIEPGSAAWQAAIIPLDQRRCDTKSPSRGALDLEHQVQCKKAELRSLFPKSVASLVATSHDVSKAQIQKYNFHP